MTVSERIAVKKPKPCSICSKLFIPIRPLQNVCTLQCGLIKAKKQRETAAERAQKATAKADRKQRREAKERVKTRRQWLVEAQASFNRFIRARDIADPCISCGRHHSGQYHAGHYLSTGARPEIRFNENNCHRQCAPCNAHLSGNLVLYRVGLINKIGLAEVERLEGPHPAAKFSIEQLREIKAIYARKARELGAC